VGLKHAHPLGEVVEGEVATGSALRQESIPLSRKPGLVLLVAWGAIHRAVLGRNGIAFARRCTWDRVWDGLVDDYCAVMADAARR
jgi:hypothetical protein